MKVLTIIGARPQFIKAAAVSYAFKKYDQLEEILVHTGQHFDDNMSAIFFDQLGILTPKYNLDIHGGGHGQMTGRMLEGLEKVMQVEQPDVVMVYGDTNSTIAGALAAKKLHIRLAHVEAGLRSFNMRMPEEVNRILTDRISDWLFCPTQSAMGNLDDEGFQNFESKAILTGDVMYDAALLFGKVADDLQVSLPDSVVAGEYLLLTLHRAENTDNPERLSAIVEALNALHAETPIVCPLHPRTRNKLAEYGLEPKFTIIDPVGYLEMVQLLRNCKAVLTDSGGLQKEAFFFHKPCITLRDETEWVELVEHGYNVLVGADGAKIRQAVPNMLAASLNFDQPLYGDGNAGGKIAEALLK